MNESFNTLVQAHKYPEVGHTRDLSLDLRTHRKPFSNNFPWISRQLFDTQGEALVFNVYTQHLGFNHVALLIQLRWVLDFLAPMMFRTGPLIMVPTGYFSLASSQGLAMTCFNPKEIRRWPGSTLRTTTSTFCPT